MLTREQVLRWLRNAARRLGEEKAYLTDLDAAIGDADHGTNIARGFVQVVEKVQPVAEKDLGTIFKTAGMTMMSAVGGASGMLYGNFFLKAATVAGSKEQLTPAEMGQVMRAGVDGILQRGRAEAGDKTMIDAWLPAMAALKEAVAAGHGLTAALQAAVAAAEQGMKETIPLQARKGRASYLGERSIGHQDPGATSSYLILNALHEAVK